MRTIDERQTTHSPRHPGGDALAPMSTETHPLDSAFAPVPARFDPSRRLDRDEPPPRRLDRDELPTRRLDRDELPTRRLDRDERHARRALRGQIARLELRLAEMVTSDLLAGARGRTVSTVAGRERSSGPRLLALGELERRRDELVARVAEVGEWRDAERENRELLAAMYRDPRAHRGARLETADLAERGCRVYEVRPRFGLVGLLGGWWRVKVSSGCPLPRGRSRAGRFRGRCDVVLSLEGQRHIGVRAGHIRVNPPGQSLRRAATERSRGGVTFSCLCGANVTSGVRAGRAAPGGGALPRSV